MFKSIFTLTLPLLFIIVHALPYPGTQQYVLSLCKYLITHFRSTGRYVRLPELQPGQPSTSSTSLVPTVIRDPQLLDLATMSELFKPAVLSTCGFLLFPPIITKASSIHRRLHDRKIVVFAPCTSSSLLAEIAVPVSQQGGGGSAKD